MRSLSAVRCLLLAPLAVVSATGDYAMYVWKSAFDVSAPECGGVYPASKTVHGGRCFKHSWETPEAREWLWASATLQGRKVRRIFLSDVKTRTQNGGKNTAGQCDPPLLALLSEAHQKGIEVYGLFAISDRKFSEQFRAGYMKEFNDACGSDTAYFSGVAVNNEYYSKVNKCRAENQYDQENYLENLKNTRDKTNGLPLHLSVGFTWGKCEVWFNGQKKKADQHMVDIVDSVDVQVAHTKGNRMADRANRLYPYWESTKMDTTPTTNFYVLAYTNPNSICKLSFAPHTKGSSTATEPYCSGGGDRTESGMFNAFDAVEDILVHAKGGIHFMGGVFSTGMEGWPKH